MARLALGVAAGVVGYFIGGPVGALQGFSLGYGLSGFLDPNQKVQGPRLNDLKSPQASYGSPIAYIEGAPRGAWNILWASDKREIATTESSGKGGPGVDSTTFTYEMDVFYLVAINSCQAVRRIWSNGKLVWSQADDSDSETLAASRSTTSWRDIRFYDGNPAQLPDPTYEAAVGVGNAPAYRGRTTIMVEGLNLGGSGQLPVLTFEVLSEAESALLVVELARVPEPEFFTGGIPASDPAGFTMLVGVVDSGTSETSTYKVYSVQADGTFTLTRILPVLLISSPLTTATGNTDRTCIVVNEGAAHKSICMFDDGSYAGPFDIFGATGFAGGAQDTRFAKTGDAYLFGGAAGFGRKLVLFNGAGAGVSSVAMAKSVISVALSGAFAYGLNLDADEIYVLDQATMTLQGTIPVPFPLATNSGSSIQGDPSGNLIYRVYLTSALPLLNGSVWQWDGAAWTMLYEQLGLIAGETGGTSPTSFSQGDGSFISQSYDNTTHEAVFRYASGQVAIVLPTLDQVVRRLCLRTGQLTDADIDVTALASDVVRAMAITQPSTMRDAIEILMRAYLFECVEGEVLRFVKRGGASVASIAYNDLGASADGTAEPLPLRRQNDPEIAARVSVKFANVLMDFQDGVAQADRLVTQSTAEQMVEIPLGFTPTEAARLADANTMDLAVQLDLLGPVSLSRKWSALEPTDVVTFTDIYGSQFRARITKATIGSGIISLELVLDDATVINSVAETDSDFASSTLIRILADTELELMDIPILRDIDDGSGIYAAFGASGPWAGAELDKSSDDVSYSKLFDVGDRATIGNASAALGDFTGVGFDDFNSLTVDVGDGTLSSSTKATLVESNTTNALLVGAEIVQFVSASLVSPGVYLLSGFLRGLRGTEWAMASHAASERVVLLQPTGIRRVADSTADIGVPYYWKAVTHGKSRALARSEIFTDTGVALKPYAPVNVAATGAGSAMLLAWNRRSRLSGLLLAPVSPPLGEAVESYEVDVVSGVTVLRTLTSNVESATYTSAQQAADGVTSATALTIKVYQMSASVGRGYPGILAAFGVRSPRPQIAEVTLGGAYMSGAAIYVILGSSRFDYTSTVGDTTLGGIATSLAALIDADADYVATAAGSVVTITGPVSLAEPLSAGQTPGDNTLSFATSQTASPTVAAVREEFIYGVLFNDSGAINPLSTATLRVYRISDGLNRYYTASPGTSNPAYAVGALMSNLHGAFVASGDRAAFDLDDAPFDGITNEVFTPLADPLGWDVQLYSSDPNMLLGVSRRGVGVEGVPAPRPQISTATLAGTPVTGRIYTVTLSGVDFSYTALVTDVAMSDVATGLAAVIDADAAYLASAVGAVVTITGAVSNVPFTFSGSITIHTVAVSSAIIQEAS